MHAPRHPGGPTDRGVDGPPLEQRRLLPRPLGLPAGRRRRQRAALTIAVCTRVSAAAADIIDILYYLKGRASGKTAMGAPWHGQGSNSSMFGPMLMRLLTIVDHL